MQRLVASLLLVVRPGAPSSVLVPSSKTRVSYLLYIDSSCSHVLRIRVQDLLLRRDQRTAGSTSQLAKLWHPNRMSNPGHLEVTQCSSMSQ